MGDDVTKSPFKEWWSLFLDIQIDKWVKYHDYWFQHAKEKNVPVYVFRFEDLINNTESVLKDIFKFLLCEESIDGTICEARIKDVIKTGNNTLYKPRNIGGGFHKYTKLVSEK